MAMPPKPKDGPDDLAEVERALSVLQGRHPEHERARREDEAARAKRAVENEAQRSRRAREALQKRLLYTGATVAVVAVTVAGGLAFRREVERRSRVDQVSSPFRAMGFVVLETSPRGEPGKLETNAEAGCFVAVGTTATSGPSGTLPVKVAAGEATAEGKGPVLLCTCERGRVTATSDVGDGGGLALLRIEASAIGGSRAFAFLPFQPGTAARTDGACAEASLDAWIDAKRAPKPVAEEAWLADPARAPLAASGAVVLAIGKPEVPFVVVDVSGQSCLVATSSRAEDTITLRTRGGAPAIPPSPGSVGTCTVNDLRLLVQHDGGPEVGELAVVAVPAAKAGGLAGLRELAVASGLALASSGLAASERAWSAKQLLVASGVPEALVTVASTPDIAADGEARVVALSFASPGALTADTPDGVFSYCEPPLDERTTESVCTFSGAQTWHLAGKDSVAGLARAKLPFWLFALQGVSDPVALKAETQMISFTRRMRREGFEPTTLEAVTELERGAEVLGRNGEDAIVAVSLAPAAPWVFPLTDGPAWTLEGTPRVVPVKPLSRVSLTSAVRGLPSAKDKRRTVVYRRAVR